MKTIAIIGAGASGLACLKTLIESNYDFNILLFERNNSIGKKIAATGNGHCNLSNLDINQEAYQGDVNEDILDMLYNFNIEKFCFELGFLTRKNGNLYYPYSRQAKTVVNAFEKLTHHESVSLFLDTMVTSIKKDQDQFIIKDQHNHSYFSDIVVVCAGGKAGNGLGTDGQIFDVVKSLNLNTIPLRPSLVSLVTKEVTKKIKGCRVHGTFTLKNNGEIVKSYKGEALFNEDGISGIACMQLSRFLEFSNDNHYTLHCNLIDELDEESLKQHFYKYKDYEGIISDKLAAYLSYKKVSSFEEYKDRLQNLTFNITGTRDFAFAQVSKGGICLEQLDQYFMSKKYPNLFFGGEILNIDGDCGGYNLHFAFSCGCKIAQGILKSISRIEE